MTARRLIAVFCLLVAPAAARAEVVAPEWTVSVGALSRLRPAHLGSVRYTTDAFPIIEATYRDTLSFSLDDGAKWNALKLGRATIGPVAEFRQAFDNSLPRAARSLQNAVEIGAFGRLDTGVGMLEVRMRKAVTGYQGWSGDIAFNTGLPITRRLSLGLEARTAWADEAFVQAHFGLRSRPERRLPEFDAADYYTVGGQVGLSYQATPRTEVRLGLDQDFIIGRQGVSPTLRSRSTTMLGLGVVFKFRAPGS